MEKYLYFMEQTDGAFDTANDAVCRSVSDFVGFGTTSTTVLDLYFTGLLENSGGTNHDKVALTIATNKHKEVMEELARHFANSSDSFIVVCDDTNSVFIHPDVTACAITVTAAG